MRIAFISTNDHVPWGGSEVLWSQTATILKNQALDVGVSVASWDPCPSHIKELAELGVTMNLRKNVIFSKKPLWERVINRFNRISQDSTSNNCEIFFREFKPDLVVISQGNLLQGKTAKRVCLKNSIPYVSIIQLVAEIHWFDDQIADELSELYNLAQMNYFVSQQNISLAERQLGRILNNAKVVRNPFNVSFDSNVIYPSIENGFNLACVASLNSIHKGQDLLFEVLRQEKWKSRPLKISLYGNGPNEKTLNRLKYLWDLEMVEFKGFRDDIESIWQENQGLIMGSRIEGLPLALVEAMLCKRIAIVPNVGGNAEVVQDNITGFLARSASCYDLDEAMERAWNCREEWQMMGERAGSFIKQLIPEYPAKVFAEELKQYL